MSETAPDRDPFAAVAAAPNASSAAKPTWWKTIADAYRRRPLLYGFFTVLGLTLAAAVMSPLLSSSDTLPDSVGKDETAAARLRTIAESLRRMDEFGQMAYAELLRDSLNPWMRQLKPAGTWEPDSYLFEIFPQFQQVTDERRQIASLLAAKQKKLSDKKAVAGMRPEEAQKEAAAMVELGKQVQILDARMGQVRAQLNEELSTLTFSLEDAFVIEGTAWLRDVSTRLRDELARREQLARGSRGAVDNLALAQELFDWTIRNIALDDREQGTELLWESLLWGRAPSATRAWIFIELCRQQGLEAVMLGYRDPNDPGNKERIAFHYWIPAVMLGQGDAAPELYLFDHKWGIPIPGPGGKGVATLTQAASSPEILAQLDTIRRYPVRSTDLKEVAAMVDVTPRLLARRMQVLESELRSADRMVFTVALSGLAARLQKARGVARVEAWPWPIQCEANARQAEPEARRSRFYLLAMKGVEEKGQKNETLRQDPQFRDLAYRQADEPEDQNAVALEQQKRGKRQQDVTGFLWRGRVLQFRGVFADSGHNREESAADPAASARKGAPNVLQSGRFTDGDLDELARGIERDLKTLQSKRAEGATRASGAELMMVDRAIENLQMQLQQMPYTRLDRQFVRMLATVWVGQVAYERGDFADAAAYFRHVLTEEEPALTKTLAALSEKLPTDAEKRLRQYTDEVIRPMMAVSKAGANYNLARALEAAGRYGEASDAYENDSSADQRPGSLYRARRLKEQLASKAAKQPGTKQPDPKTPEKKAPEAKTSETKTPEPKSPAGKPTKTEIKQPEASSGRD